MPDLTGPASDTLDLRAGHHLGGAGLRPRALPHYRRRRTSRRRAGAVRKNGIDGAGGNGERAGRFRPRIRDAPGFLAESVKASQQASDLAQARYNDGATDFLTVLDAERVLLEAQDQLAQTDTQTATALVAVYKALGGGWEGVPQPK